jgi:glycosyltransferase involved in cell wall biosynthesis
VKIAQVAPLFEAVPPEGYGGTERVVSWLCEGLTSMGHDVTLFAAGGSHSSARLIPCRDQPIRTDMGLCSDASDHALMMDKVRERADEFDVIHFHTDIMQMPFFEERAGKTLTTLHGRLDLKGLPELLYRFSDFPLVSISDHQRRAAPRANYIGTIYHGLPAESYAPSYATDQEYVAFLGRFSPEKGPDKAINIALRAGIPIRLAAKICPQLRANQVYYHDVIRPLLALPGVEYLGEISNREKSDFLRGAKAVLFPIDWPEPFGLVMIEAFACGTPVLAYGHGSVPEIVEHGVTGFVVENQAQAIAAARRIDRLDRQACRRLFERRFTARTMAQGYLAVYRQLLDTHRSQPRNKE